MSEQSSDNSAALRALAERQGFSLEAVRAMLAAVQAGGGRAAQFDHPEFGGMGQWFSGGMVMIGRMNDYGLQARVSALCEEIAAALPELSPRKKAGSPTGQAWDWAPSEWWPEGLGRPSSVGSQNATRYAWFPETRRHAVETHGRLALYDTGEHVITGASQQQSGTSSFRFSGPRGDISLEDLKPVEQPHGASPARTEPQEPAPSPAPKPTAAPASPIETIVPEAARPPVPEASHAPVPPPPSTSHGASDVLATLERLAELHRKGVLTDAEFSGKKAELLARL